MISYAIKYILVALVVIVCISMGLSYFFQVPYIYSAMGLTALPLAGHLITIDDDMPSGWWNPDGSRRFPWGELLVKALFPVILLLSLLVFPELAAYGA